jgi:hypothetical protein
LLPTIVPSSCYCYSLLYCVLTPFQPLYSQFWTNWLFQYFLLRTQRIILFPKKVPKDNTNIQLNIKYIPKFQLLLKNADCWNIFKHVYPNLKLELQSYVLKLPIDIMLCCCRLSTSSNRLEKEDYFFDVQGLKLIVVVLAMELCKLWNVIKF